MIKYSALARQANRADADAVLPSEHVKAAQLRRQAEYYRFKAQNSTRPE